MIRFLIELKNFLFIFIAIFCAVFAISLINKENGRLEAVWPFFILGQECSFSDKKDSIFIPELGIEAPIVFSNETDKQDYVDSLARGVVHFPGSANPGRNGLSILLGHSAPIGWPKIRYEWVFSELNSLRNGDEIKIISSGCQYSYRVSGKYFLDKGEELPEKLTKSRKPVLVLISCWPPGRDLRRIAVSAEFLR